MINEQGPVMNPVVNDQLNEFARANTITSQEPAAQFEIYSIFTVLSGHLGENIDAYDVHLAGNEFGLDGIAIIIQGISVGNSHVAEDLLNKIKNPEIEFIFFQ